MSGIFESIGIDSGIVIIILLILTIILLINVVSSNMRLSMEMLSSMAFRTRVRLPSPPPFQNNRKRLK